MGSSGRGSQSQASEVSWTSAGTDPGQSQAGGRWWSVLKGSDHVPRGNCPQRDEKGYERHCFWK